MIQHESGLEALEAAANVDESKTSDHMAAMWAGQSNVLVAVRVRPVLKHDVVRKSCVRVLDSKVIVILDPAHTSDKQDILRANRSREKQYAFDYAFEPGSSQEATYHHTTKFLIHGVLDGFSATVFAYGQTGSGKTHTMIGTQENPGIMVRVMSDLFKHSVSQASKLGLGVYFKVTASFLEVYNENIRDLLAAPGSSMDDYLDLREDPIKGPVVAGITEVEVHTSGEIMQLLHQGNAKRSQAATAANEVSSRSHAVLQVTVESRDRAPGVVDSIKVGKLSLIDLAGSERAANTQNRGARLTEGANINRSLLALGNCINALGEKGNKGNFVPYRDSKLTRLLKDSLGGNCRTVMIANISPAESSFEETLNTLKYANRAKNIKTQVKRNVLNVNYHISEYVELINNLRSEIQVLKNQIEVNPTPSDNHNADGSLNEPTLDAGAGKGKFAAFGNNVNVNGFAMPVPVNINKAVQEAIDSNPGGPAINSLPTHVINLSQGSNTVSTPLNSIRGNLRSAGIRVGTAVNGKDRELVNSMRQMIVNNFQERMQLRRSLIELEDQNVQNSIEISKRELIVVNWTATSSGGSKEVIKDSAELSAKILAEAPTDIASAWRECEQIRKAVLKNNGMKRSIAKRLRHNEREAERVRDELGDKITGEDRRELMELQYQVGRLELENMELEQHRIVHESILKGKDLVIQKLKLQLAVKEKLIQRQTNVLRTHGLEAEVGYQSLAMFEDTLLGDQDPDVGIHNIFKKPNSPPRTMTSMGREHEKKMKQYSPRADPNNDNDGNAIPTRKSVQMSANAAAAKRLMLQKEQQAAERRTSGPDRNNAHDTKADKNVHSNANSMNESVGSDSSPYHSPVQGNSPRSPRHENAPVQYRDKERYSKNGLHASPEPLRAQHVQDVETQEHAPKPSQVLTVPLSLPVSVDILGSHQPSHTSVAGEIVGQELGRGESESKLLGESSLFAEGEWVEVHALPQVKSNVQRTPPQKVQQNFSTPPSVASVHAHNDSKPPSNSNDTPLARRAQGGVNGGGDSGDSRSIEKIFAGKMASLQSQFNGSGSGVPMPQQMSSQGAPSVYDSPSMPPTKSNTNPKHYPSSTDKNDSLVNENGNGNDSMYQQVYPMAFNDQRQNQQKQQQWRQVQVRGQEQRQIPARRGKGLSNFAHYPDKVPKGDSPQSSPRLMLGHELDEPSIVTVVSEASLEAEGGPSHSNTSLQQQQNGRHYAQSNYPSQPSQPPLQGQGQPRPQHYQRVRDSDTSDYDESSLSLHDQQSNKKSVLEKLNRKPIQQQQQPEHEQLQQAPYQQKHQQFHKPLQNPSIDQQQKPSASKHYNPYFASNGPLLAPGPPRGGGAPGNNPRQQMQQRAQRQQIKARLDMGGQQQDSDEANVMQQHQPTRPIRGVSSNKVRDMPADKHNKHKVPSLQPYLDRANNQSQNNHGGQENNSQSSVNNLRMQLRNMSKPNAAGAYRQPRSARDASADPIMGYRVDPQINSAR